MEDIRKIINKHLNKLKNSPGTLFGFLYPYILTVIVIIGIYYLANMGSTQINKIPGAIPDTTVTSDIPVVLARTVPPIDIFKMKVASPEIIQKGKELYTTICASCHNETGAGGGPASIGLNPAPRNFMSQDGWKNGRTISNMYTTLEEGIEGSSMISYNFLTPEERISLIHYVRSQFMKDAPADTDDDLSALDQMYNLSFGMEIPAQIPVSAAKELIVTEANQKSKKLNEILISLKEEQSNPAAKLFDSVTDDNVLAFSSLINSDNWKYSENDFINFLTLNVHQNGFNGRIFSLTDSEWNVLYNYLNNVL